MRAALLPDEGSSPPSPAAPIRGRASCAPPRPDEGHGVCARSPSRPDEGHAGYALRAALLPDEGSSPPSPAAPVRSRAWYPCLKNFPECQQRALAGSRGSRLPPIRASSPLVCGARARAHVFCRTAALVMPDDLCTVPQLPPGRCLLKQRSPARGAANYFTISCCRNKAGLCVCSINRSFVVGCLPPHTRGQVRWRVASQGVLLRSRLSTKRARQT